MTYVRRVYKYPLPLSAFAEVEMPRGARILRCDVQQPADLSPTIWALVDRDEPNETRSFRIAGTGHPVGADDAEHFVATVIAAGGTLVWHVFELDPPTPAPETWREQAGRDPRFESRPFNPETQRSVDP